MRDQRLEVKDIVENIDSATLGKLDVPEFQRGYVWTAEKAKKFVDSLWRGYPVGTILLWESEYSEPKVAKGSGIQRLWIVDGQQRITTLSLMLGKKPYWWAEAEEWNELFSRYDVLVDVSKPMNSMEFSLPNPVRSKSPEWVSVRTVLTSQNLSRLADEIAKRNKQDFSEVHEKLQSIKRIENYPLYEIIINHEIEDVAEIFTRLNSAGVKVRESDIIIALVAAKQGGWVRGEFNPFLAGLEDRGFELDPAILIRSLAVIGKGVARLRDISKSFWEKSDEFQNGWDETKRSISHITRNMFEAGVLSSDILPSHNTLIPLFALCAKFGHSFRFKRALYWFLLATRDGRYSGSAITVLDQDTKIINESPTFDEAINALVEPLRVPDSFTKEDFLKDYDDDFFRLVLYLLVFNNEAKDWIYQDIRIGYDRSDRQLNEGFKPEWHHFFPKKVLREHQADQSRIDSLANRAILNERANRMFTSKEPREYLRKYNVDVERLVEQLIPVEETLWQVTNYERLLDRRASGLADSASEYMGKLKDS
jgi:hypothetical protein